MKGKYVLLAAATAAAAPHATRLAPFHIHMVLWDEQFSSLSQGPKGHNA